MLIPSYFLFVQKKYIFHYYMPHEKKFITAKQLLEQTLETQKQQKKLRNGKVYDAFVTEFKDPPCITRDSGSDYRPDSETSPKEKIKKNKKTRRKIRKNKNPKIEAIRKRTIAEFDMDKFWENSQYAKYLNSDFSFDSEEPPF